MVTLLEKEGTSETLGLTILAKFLFSQIGGNDKALLCAL